MRSGADLHLNLSLYEQQVGSPLEGCEDLVVPQVAEDEWVRVPFPTKGESQDRGQDRC